MEGPFPMVPMVCKHPPLGKTCPRDYAHTTSNHQNLDALRGLLLLACPQSYNFMKPRTTI